RRPNAGPGYEMGSRQCRRVRNHDVMLSELIRDTFAYIQPAATISDLGPDEAVTRVGEASHSVAELVAHLAFWQDWFLARCHGKDVPMAASAADGWPATSAADWPAIRDRFVRGLDEAVA